MKSIALKIVISIFVVMTAAIFVHYLTESNQASDDGKIRVIIVDENGQTVFDDDLIILQGDNFYDILNREFSLTCASSSYQADDTCSDDFQSFAYQGKILLGISNHDFNVQTNWSDNFLAIEQYDGTDYYLATQGVSNIDFLNKDRIRISVRSTSEGLS
ncbi:MAG: hypothetical protein KKG64_05560 [Firmicutes bacterium]|nr:hypothetical protein [Bacillota bacterium]